MEEEGGGEAKIPSDYYKPQVLPYKLFGNSISIESEENDFSNIVPRKVRLLADSTAVWLTIVGQNDARLIKMILTICVEVQMGPVVQYL